MHVISCPSISKNKTHTAVLHVFAMFHSRALLADHELLFYDRPIGAGLRVLTLGSGESSRDALWCPILGMDLIRRLAIIFPMVLRSLLCTMSVSLSYWWCTTGNNAFNLSQTVSYFSILGTLDLYFCMEFCSSWWFVFWTSIVYVTQDLLCWDCTQRVHKEEKRDSGACSSARCCCY